MANNFTTNFLTRSPSKQSPRIVAYGKDFHKKSLQSPRVMRTTFIFVKHSSLQC